MSRDFSDFHVFGRHLERVARAVPRETAKGLERIGKRVTADAQRRIGTDQQLVLSPQGQAFVGWAPLKDSTVADRVAKGFTPNDPLLRTGLLRAGIGYTAAAWHVTVGSGDEIAAFQEFGTFHIPPRPFIGAAMAARMEVNLREMREAIERAFRQTN